MVTKQHKTILTRTTTSIIILIQCYILLFNLFSGSICVIVFSVLWAIFFILTIPEFGLKATLIRAIIYSIPTSFFNIMGTDYGELPLSFFNLFSLVLLCLILAQWFIKDTIKIKKPLFVILLGALIFCSIIPTAYSVDIFNAIKQFLNVILFCALVIVGLVTTIPPKTVKTIIDDYLRVAIITCIGLISQIIIYKNMGIIYGKLEAMGGMRTAYGFLFSDYSFLSLYLSSAALISITLMLHNRKINIPLIGYGLLLMYGSILTTARTGLVALLCALVFYGLILFFKRPLFSIVAIFTVVLLSGYYISYSTNQRNDMVNDSGRIAGYSTGLHEFEKNPLFGTGYGVQSYNNQYDIAIPHNIIIQYFVQGGLFVGFLVVLILISIFILVYKDGPDFILPVLTVIIGAQFIPDIFNSRFFPVIIMLSLLTSGTYSRKSEVNIIEDNTTFTVKQ